MWLLLFCSVLGGAVFLERSLFYFRVTLHLGDFMRGLSNLIRHQRWSEAQVECASFSTPVTRVLHSAVLRHGAPREELRAIVQEAGQLEVLRLEQNLGLISGIGLVAPLIGLLGTVTGMIEVFSKISSQSGLTSSIGYAYLSSRVNALMRDMERAGIEVVNLIMDSRVESQIIEFGSASRSPRSSRPSTGAAE